MKRIIITISILLGLAISAMAATKTLNKPVTLRATNAGHVIVGD